MCVLEKSRKTSVVPVTVFTVMMKMTVVVMMMIMTIHTLVVKP